MNGFNAFPETKIIIIMKIENLILKIKTENDEGKKIEKKFAIFNRLYIYSL